ncbi:MAG: thioesterase family protein [Rikenellaceae bacterium]|nr:thioesterase family protein [Rikenellaceae bacterium]
MITTRTPIQARFGDYDLFGHVNNVSQQQYLDIGRIAFINEHICPEMFRQSLRVILVSVNMDFVNQLTMGCPVDAITELESVGTKSIRLRQTLVKRLDDGTEVVCTRSTSVLVAWDTSTQQAVPVPDEWRRRLTL